MYPVLSGCYISGRQVVGLEVILGGLAASGSQQKQLNKFRVLDAGSWCCGANILWDEGSERGKREGGRNLLEFRCNNTLILQTYKPQNDDIGVITLSHFAILG